MLMSVEIGRDNFREGSIKANVFVCPTHAYPVQEEYHLWMAGTDKAPRNGPPIQKTGAPQVIPAGQDMNQEIVGKWTTQVYDIPPGTLLKLNFVKSANGRHRSASMLLKVREGAALNRINIDTTPNNKATKRRLVYEGRFDILTLDQAKAEGYRVAAAFEHQYDQAKWRSLPFVRVEQVAPETAGQQIVKAKKVVNSEGVPVEVQVAHARRMLDLG